MRPGGRRTPTVERGLATGRLAAGTVRAFRPGDIPAVVALRHQLFRKTEHRVPASLAAYLDETFFAHQGPRTSALDSLVYEDAGGRLQGFLGVVPRRMMLDGKPIRVAIGTQLMVAPGTEGMVGPRLVKAYVDGPQDLSLSDAANDAARRLFERAGGQTAVSYSLFWYRALRPLRSFMSRRAHSTVARALAFAARPACAAIDAVLAVAPSARPPITPGDVASTFDATHHLGEMKAIFAYWRLYPSYDLETIEWVLSEVARKRNRGVPRQVVVHDRHGHLLGWFMYCGRRGRVGEVVQVAARRGAYRRVLAHLYRDAHRLGLTGLAGRLEPAATGDLAATGATFSHEGPWMLVHSRHPEVISAIETGNAFISRLDAEWWLSF